tara:strand:- start:9 stop:461 length:453 start_codon:yes stop_codon:yes gene_type:complete
MQNLISGIKGTFMLIRILLSLILFSSMSNLSFAMPPEPLFKEKWSEVCAEKQGTETGEYVTFSDAEKCFYSVDTFRVHSRCEPAQFKEMDANRIQMTLNDKDKYVIEFLWASQISVMQVISEEPYTLKQHSILGRAETRENLLTHYLYCP